jgi:hypothetical protein
VPDRLPRDGKVMTLKGAVPLDAWNEVIARSAYFDRTLVPLPQPAEDGDLVEICIHPTLAFVEAAGTFRDIPTIIGAGDAADIRRPAVRHYTQSSCDEGLTLRYANFLMERAIALIPQCTALERNPGDSASYVLRQCGTFSGDTLAAAEVANRMDKPDRVSVTATIDWAGEPPITEVGKAHDRWAVLDDRSGAYAYQFFAIIGETADRVHVEGQITHEPGAERPLQFAATEETWLRGDDGAFVLQHAKVGPFRERKPKDR